MNDSSNITRESSLETYQSTLLAQNTVVKFGVSFRNIARSTYYFNLWNYYWNRCQRRAFRLAGVIQDNSRCRDSAAVYRWRLSQVLCEEWIGCVCHCFPESHSHSDQVRSLSYLSGHFPRTR